MSFVGSTVDRRFGFSQLDAALPSELGVEAQNLDREVHLVDDALAGGMVFRPEFEIIRLVIRAAAVFVMDSLAFAKRATKNFFHYNAMLESLVPAAKMQPDVATGVLVSFGVYRAPTATFVTAFSAAKYLFALPSTTATVSTDAWTVGRGFAAELALESRRWFDAHIEQLLRRQGLVKEIV